MAPAKRKPAARRSTADAQRERIAAIPGLDAALAVIAERIDERRGTSEQLAHSSGLTTGTVKRVRLRHQDPKLSTLLKLCSGLGMTSTELLGDLPPLPPERKRAPSKAAKSGKAARGRK